MTITEHTAYDPSITCATLRENGLEMALLYRFQAQTWELVTRTTRTGLARFRPSNYPAPKAMKPETFESACENATKWLRFARSHVYAADRDRMTETGADYLR